MVKVTGPLFSIEARGRLGTLEYNTWRGLRVVRSHVDPPTPTRPRQLAQQAVITGLSQNWKNLTQARRDRWNEAAQQLVATTSMGGTFTMSGFNLYVSRNTWAWLNSATTIDDPQPEIPMLAVPVTKNGQDPGGVSLGWTTTMDPSDFDFDLVIRVFGPHSAGRKPDFHKAVYLAHAVFFDSALSVPYASWPGTGLMSLYSKLISHITGQHGPWSLTQITVDPWV